MMAASSANFDPPSAGSEPPAASSPAPSRGLVLLVDDDRHVRTALKFMLESAGYSVTACASGAEFFALGEPAEPFCLILDERMPDLKGTEIQARLARRRLPTSTIFLTACADVRMAVAAIHAGAIDVLEKLPSPQELFRCVDIGLQRSRENWTLFAEYQQLQQLLETLTGREQDVVKLIVEGQSSSKAIADELLISERTAEKHRSRVLLKLSADSVATAVRICLRYKELDARFGEPSK